MEFMKYQRDEWELQKVRIKKIVGHCDAAEPEQYVNTLLAMLEERNSPKAESAEKSTNNERDAIKKAYIEGYSKGHNDTVECGDYCPEESADDWLSE